MYLACAIELVMANSPRDIAATDIAISLDSQLLAWNAASEMFFVGGDSTAGETCGTDPGANGNDVWEPGAAIQRDLGTFGPGPGAGEGQSPAGPPAHLL